jgi:hypothetical protein
MKSADKSRRIYGCKLTRADLDALVRTAVAGASPKMSLRVSTTQGITKYEATSLNDLLAELGSPTRLGEIDIVAYDLSEVEYRPGQRSRLVRISADRERVRLSVSGQDETWVRGRFQELEDLLVANRSKLAIGPDAASFIPLAIGPVLGLGVVALATFGPLSVPVVVSLVAGALGVWLLAWRMLGRISATAIVLAEKSRTPWSRGDLIAAAIFLAAVVTIVLSVVKT